MSKTLPPLRGDFAYLNQRGPKSPAPAPYDPHHQDHQTWLLWWLDQMEVPFSRIDDFGFAMAGKPVRFFNVLVQQWRAEQVRTSQAQERQTASILAPSPPSEEGVAAPALVVPKTRVEVFLSGLKKFLLPERKS